MEQFTALNSNIWPQKNQDSRDIDILNSPKLGSIWA